MLAYVFWHWPRPDVAAAEYEARQRGFHEALAAAPPAGFHHSYTHALPAPPWAPAQGAVYEDWYLVRDSAALDPLNDAAVSASRAAPHDRAAAVAAGGTAGLYALRHGAAPAGGMRHACWLARPEAMSYRELAQRLDPLVDGAGAALWMRRMVLGPAPEFCIQSRAPLRLPPELEGWSAELRPVWPA